MANWDEVTKAAPELAKLVQTRIEAVGMAFLATLRQDGFPRISGIEASFDGGELAFGMMLDSLKAKDLRRDPRFSLHNASVDKEVKDADVKITGFANEVVDPAVREAMRARVKEETGYDPGTDFHLFWCDVKEMSSVRPEGDHLVIESWREGEEVRRRERK